MTGNSDTDIDIDNINNSDNNSDNKNQVLIIIKSLLEHQYKYIPIKYRLKHY